VRVCVRVAMRRKVKGGHARLDLVTDCYHSAVQKNNPLLLRSVDIVCSSLDM